MPESRTITYDNLQEDIHHYTRELGYRLDMIKPADDPREAIVSKQGKSSRLVRKSEPQKVRTLDVERVPGGRWVLGRAGMMYRDLVPGRLGGKLIASHIRIIDGGDVPDNVHYHKIDFQFIHCLKGAIRVVYEDQGPPVWLRPGDWVLQPPEIRHRVLEAEAGSEVIELTSPAEHETWFDHDLDLPNDTINPNRPFGGQRFAYHKALGIEIAKGRI
jgi:quercetin dioxygenase-like cupin family protein